VQSETRLPFAGLHQLLRPLLDRASQLPGRQRDALLAAFGVNGGTAEPFLIALGALALLSEEAAERPILLNVDDAHWLDRPTAQVLSFVGRRLESDAVTMLVAVRDGYETPLRGAGLPELHVTALGDETAEQLLDDRFPDLTRAARTRVMEEADGNPLGFAGVGRCAASRRRGSTHELQIVQLVAQGLSNRDITQRLFLSYRTVESHLYRVFRKLGVTSRFQLVDAVARDDGAARPWQMTDP
jgi:hypothetical protein